MSQNKPNSPWVEINKKLAEKLTVFIEQNAAIKEYKSQQEKLKGELEIIEQKTITAKLENTLLENTIQQKMIENQRIVGYAEVLEERAEQTSIKIRNAEKEMQKQWEEHTSNMERRQNRFHEMIDVLYSRESDYAEYKKLRESNQKLEEEMEVQRTEWAREKAKLEAAQATRTKERNNMVIKLATSAQNLNRLHCLQRKYQEVEAEYKAATQNLMQTLTNISPVEEEELSPIEITDTAEGKLEKLLSQHKSITEAQKTQNTQISEKVATPEQIMPTEAQFKVPNIPDNVPSATQPTSAHKVAVLQDIEISNTPMDSHYFARNKRKETNFQKPDLLQKKTKSNMEVDPFGAPGDFDFGNVEASNVFSFGGSMDVENETNGLDGGFAGFGAKSPESEDSGPSFSAFQW